MASLYTSSKLPRASFCPHPTLLNSNIRVDPTNFTWKHPIFTITTWRIRQGRLTLQGLMRLNLKLRLRSPWRHGRLKKDKEELEGLKVMMAVAWLAQFWIGAEQEPLAGLKTNNKSKHQLFSHSRELVFRLAAGKLLPVNLSSIQKRSVHWWKSIRTTLNWLQRCFNPCGMLKEKLRCLAWLSQRSPLPTQILTPFVHCKYAVQMAHVY